MRRARREMSGSELPHISLPYYWRTVNHKILCSIHGQSTIGKDRLKKTQRKSISEISVERYKKSFREGWKEL